MVRMNCRKKYLHSAKNVAKRNTGHPFFVYCGLQKGRRNPNCALCDIAHVKGRFLIIRVNSFTFQLGRTFTR